MQFGEELKGEPYVIEKTRVHEVWSDTAEELLRWGDVTVAKSLLVEATFHARVLKDQGYYARSMHNMS